MKDKILNYIKQNLYLILAVVASIFAFSVILATFLITIPSLSLEEATIFHQGLRNNRLLDGQEVHYKRTNLKPIAIILENHIESRPVSGLDKASIIYEVIVEGDITRFFAIYDGGFSSDKIGPVRSVRPFFVELAEEWDPILFHAGGSASGLYKLSYSSVYNINEISKDGIYFWRDAKRDPPHNLYISSNQINRALVAKNINEEEGDFLPWYFKDDQPAYAKASAGKPTSTPEELSNFEVVFSNNPFYDVEYKYNADSNDYTRVINDKTHKTDKGIVLKAKNVVVQKVDAKILDSYGRISIELDGQGESIVYQDGRKIVGTWEKESGRTRFYDFEGTEIKFNRGNIWIELVFN